MYSLIFMAIILANSQQLMARICNEGVSTQKCQFKVLELFFIVLTQTMMTRVETIHYIPSYVKQAFANKLLEIIHVQI